MTGLGAMMIVLGKRRVELVTAVDGGAEQQRAVLGAYSLRALNVLIGVSAAGVLAAYVAYTLTASGLPDNMAMALTVPIAAFGLYRYLRLLYRDGSAGETPEEMFLSDRPMQAAAVPLAGNGAGRPLAWQIALDRRRRHPFDGVRPDVALPTNGAARRLKVAGRDGMPS